MLLFILYLIYTSDIPITSDTTVETFVDKTTLLANSDNPTQVRLNFQNHLRLQQPCSEKKEKFELTKADSTLLILNLEKRFRFKTVHIRNDQDDPTRLTMDLRLPQPSLQNFH